MFGQKFICENCLQLYLYRPVTFFFMDIVFSRLHRTEIMSFVVLEVIENELSMMIVKTTCNNHFIDIGIFSKK